MIVGGIGRTNGIRVAVRSLPLELGPIDVVVIACRRSGDSGCARVGHVVDIADRERFARAMKICEDRVRLFATSPTATRRMILAVDDADVWRSLSIADKGLGYLWDGFERVVAVGPSAGVICIVTSSSEQGLPASLRSRMDAIWTGTDRAGVFSVSDRIGVDGPVVQLFWEDPDRIPMRTSNPDIETSLSVLPDVITIRRRRTAFAIEADSREEISVLRQDRLRSLILGSPGSGVTTSIRSLAVAWSAANDRGRVITVEPADPMCIPLLESWLAESHGEPVLVVIEDVQRMGESAAVIARMIADPSVSTRLSIIAGTTGRFVRTHPDHWIQALRRERTGFLLGRCIDEDCDLLGVHAIPLHMYRISPGRGLWVEGGTPRGVVQFVCSPPFPGS